MAVVNTNVNASIAQNALTRNERSMNAAMEKLSTGQRINSAADDAAGLAISSRMSSQIRGLETGIRNANDAISMISTADGALVEVSNMLQRMRELALQSANGTTTEADRNYLNSEYANLISEIDRIAQNTQWNGMDLLNHATTASSTIAYQVGANGGQTISVDFGDFNNTGATGVMQDLNSAHGFILDFGRYHDFHLYDQVGMDLYTHLKLSSVSKWSVWKLYFAFFYLYAFRNARISNISNSY